MMNHCIDISCSYSYSEKEYQLSVQHFISDKSVGRASRLQQPAPAKYRHRLLTHKFDHEYFLTREGSEMFKTPSL